MLIGLEKEQAVIKSAIAQNTPILIIGETGVGKTSMIRELAHEAGATFRRLNLNGSTGVEEFIGKMTLEATKGGTNTVWQDGILIDAMRKGEWLLVDEINAALPEILFVLQSLLDDDRYVVVADNKGEVVKPHKNFRFFAAMNPPADYAGTKKLNRALLSRFGVVLRVETPDLDKLQAIVTSHVAEINPDTLTNFCRLAEHINLSKKEGGVDFYCSVRDLIALAKLVAAGNDEETAFHLAILNKTDDHERTAIKSLAALYIALKGEAQALTAEQREKAIIQDIIEFTSRSTYQAELAICSQTIQHTMRFLIGEVPSKHEDPIKDIYKKADFDKMARHLIDESNSHRHTAGAINEGYQEYLAKLKKAAAKRAKAAV